MTPYEVGVKLARELFDKSRWQEAQWLLPAAYGAAGLGALAYFAGTRGTRKHETFPDTYLRASRIADQMLADRPDLNKRLGVMPYKADASMTVWEGNKQNPRAAGTLLLQPGARDATIAHEIGHYQNHAALGPTLDKVSRLPRIIPKISDAATLIMSALDKKDSYAPGLVNLAINAPSLSDEAAASIRATKHQIGQHGLLKGIGSSATLAPAFATYAVPAVAPMALTAIKRIAKGKPLIGD